MKGVETLVGQLPNSNCGCEAARGVNGVVWGLGVLLRVVVSCLQEVVPPVLQGRGGGREVRGRGRGQEVVLRGGRESGPRPEGFTWVQLFLLGCYY